MMFGQGKRIYLGSVETPGRTLYYTLVLDAGEIYVEREMDSKFPMPGERVESINPRDFKNHTVNGLPLDQVVALALEAMEPLAV